MFKLYEFKNDNKVEVLPEDNIYTVHELGLYQLEYSATFITHNVFFIEDENITEKSIKKFDSTHVITSPFRYFEDYFGFATVSINDEQFQFNILVEKLKSKEIEDIILYLFNNNNYILNNFLSKSSVGGAEVYNGKEYFYSSKYLRLINEFCNSFEELFSRFKSLSNTKLIKKHSLSDYSTIAIDDKSIEWILHNLDSMLYDNSLKYHPHSIAIENNYGIIEKIGAEQNENSYSTYENEIILGAYKFLQFKISEIKNKINERLNTKDNSKIPYMTLQYIDFRDLKKIPYLKLLNEINAIEKRLGKLKINYKLLFPHTLERNEFPKLTPTFYKYKHYQSAYNQIRLLRNSEYDLNGEIQLLNVRKLSELYEKFNLSIIIDILNKILPEEKYEKNILETKSNGVISQVSYTEKSNDFKLTLFYEPNINNKPSQIDLITIGNVKLMEKNCKPDFVIEIQSNLLKRYCIIDSKYSKFNTVKTAHLTGCIKKYIMDIGVINNPYQKPDYLILIHPDSSDPEENLIYDKYFFPKIQTAISKPQNYHKLENLLLEFTS